MSRRPASPIPHDDPTGAPQGARSRCRVVSIALALALLPAGTLTSGAPATAQTAPAEPDAIRRKLEAQQQELQSKKDRESALAKDVTDIDAERERINARLLETAALIQKSEGKMTAIESRLGELEAQERIVRGSLDQRHGQIAKLLGALQRMGRNPPPVMITQRADALEMVRSAMLLAAAFPEMRGQALQLSTRLQELVRVMDDIRTESTRLKSETERLADAQTKLAGLMEERKQSLAQRKAELSDVRRAATEISKSVTDLNELITRLDKAVNEKTGLGAYDREARAAEAAAEAAAATPQPVAPAASPAAAASPSGPIVVMPQQSVGGAPGATPPFAVTPPPAAPAAGTKVAAITVPKPSEFIELKPGGGGLRADPGRIKPAIAFHQARGRLPLPAHGQRVLNFGEKTSYGHPSKGIVLETRPGAQITSPCDGWIIYAGEFRSYGQLLIINAGGGYHVLLAGLSRIDVEYGQFVLAAEPVGTMSGAISGGGPAREVKNETNTPVLYVELRKDGRPIDPSPWWANGSDTVQDKLQDKVQE